MSDITLENCPTCKGLGGYPLCGTCKNKPASTVPPSPKIAGLSKTLSEQGLSKEAAEIVTGLVVAYTMEAFSDGYTKGYNAGLAEFKNKQDAELSVTYTVVDEDGEVLEGGFESRAQAQAFATAEVGVEYKIVPEVEPKFVVRDYSGHNSTTVLRPSEFKARGWDMEYVSCGWSFGEWLEMAEIGDDFDNEDDATTITRIA